MQRATQILQRLRFVIFVDSDLLNLINVMNILALVIQDPKVFIDCLNIRPSHIIRRVIRDVYKLAKQAGHLLALSGDIVNGREHFDEFLRLGHTRTVAERQLVLILQHRQLAPYSVCCRRIPNVGIRPLKEFLGIHKTPEKRSLIPPFSEGSKERHRCVSNVIAPIQILCVYFTKRILSGSQLAHDFHAFAAGKGHLRLIRDVRNRGKGIIHII